jgi:hypothetical protein
MVQKPLMDVQKPQWRCPQREHHRVPDNRQVPHLQQMNMKGMVGSMVGSMVRSMVLLMGRSRQYLRTAMPFYMLRSIDSVGSEGSSNAVMPSVDRRSDDKYSPHS